MADEQLRTAPAALGRHWWKWALLALLAWLAFVLVAAVGVVLIVWPDEITFLGEDRDEQLFSAAKAASVAVLEYQRERGRLPSSLSEAPELEAAVARMVSECETLGAAAPEAALVPVAEEAEGEQPPAVIVRDRESEILVAISADGEVAISSTVMTRRARRVPDWIEILR